MSSGQNIQARDHSSDPAPTPQNTPLDTAVLANRPANIGRPKVEDVAEGEDEDDDEDGAEDVGAMNPASLLAKVSRSEFIVEWSLHVSWKFCRERQGSAT
jgi:nucleosome assembly protein 1-like 1